jgi:hypothetical protein
MRKLPSELVERRLKELEDRFNSTLSCLAKRILNDAEDKRIEHQSKTYVLVSEIHKEVCRRKKSNTNFEFFVLGEERSIEKARAHMFSNSATGLFELGFVPVG